jgi:hypothetical protein
VLDEVAKRRAERAEHGGRVATRRVVVPRMVHKELKPLRTHYCTVSSRTWCVHPIFEYKRGRARSYKAAAVEGARETRARARNLGRADPDTAPQRATQGGWGAAASYEDSGWRTVECAAARRVPAELLRKEVVPEANER